MVEQVSAPVLVRRIGVALGESAAHGEWVESTACAAATDAVVMFWRWVGNRIRRDERDAREDRELGARNSAPVAM